MVVFFSRESRQRDLVSITIAIVLLSFLVNPLSASESGHILALWSRDVRKLAVVSGDGVRYLAVYSLNQTEQIEPIMGEDIKNYHIILNNYKGQVTFDVIRCVFGVSFAVWSDGSPIPFERVPMGIFPDKQNADVFFSKTIWNGGLLNFPTSLDQMRELNIDGLKILTGGENLGQSLISP